MWRRRLWWVRGLWRLNSLLQKRFWSMCIKEVSGDSGRQYQPRSLLLQWHVTERCNLRCAHCYQDSNGCDELSYDELLQILHQFRELLKAWRGRTPDRRVGGHITLTGGEPFVRYDFVELLEELYRRQKEFSYAILTNGTLIDDSLARWLGKHKPAFVQVSIEGDRATHDRIRGAGSYDAADDALRRLRRRGVRTLISFTAHRQNYREFPAVAQLGREIGVSRVWADRLIPTGAGVALREQMLTPSELQEFLRIMRAEQSVPQRRWRKGTEIAMRRALQFLVAGGRPYHCTAGDSLLTVQPNGDLYPCRRMPVRIGNLLEQPLSELYYGSELLRNLRDRTRVSHGCESCIFRRDCRGGLKCLSHAVYADPFVADPGCWRASVTARTSVAD